MNSRTRDTRYRHMVHRFRSEPVFPEVCHDLATYTLLVCVKTSQGGSRETPRILIARAPPGSHRRHVRYHAWPYNCPADVRIHIGCLTFSTLPPRFLSPRNGLHRPIYRATESRRLCLSLGREGYLCDEILLQQYPLSAHSMAGAPIDRAPNRIVCSDE